MPEKRDYYEVLGVGRDATDEDLRKAFRKLAFKYHPDHNHNDKSGDSFKEVNEAYEVLSNHDKRTAYDRFGHSGAEGFYGRGFEGFGSGGFGDIFEAFFGGATTTRHGPQRGADLVISTTVTLKEAALGCEKEVTILRTEHCSACGGTGCKPGAKPQKCPNCNGRGQVHRVQQSIFGRFTNVATCPQCQGTGSIITDPCTQCRGTGREKGKHTLSVNIPAGVETGSQIRIHSEGHAGTRGGRHGDLYITLSVERHDTFRRDGDDIIYELQVNFAQAALGTEVHVPTIEDEEAKLKVPAGSQGGRVFRLKNKGVHHLRGRGRGDQIVVLNVLTPQSLSKRQKQLLKELGETLETDEA